MEDTSDSDPVLSEDTSDSDIPETRVSAAQQLHNLLILKGGRPATVNTAASERRRVVRIDGYASRVAALFAAIIVEVNEVHSLTLGPMTMMDVLARTDEGKNLLEQAQHQKEVNILAQAACNMSSNAGRACAGTVTGLMAAPNAAGRLSTKRVKQLTGKSASNIKFNRLKVQKAALGCFGNQSMVPDGRRRRIPITEQVY